MKHRRETNHVSKQEINFPKLLIRMGIRRHFFDYLLQEWKKADKMESREGRTVNSEEMGRV